MSETDAIEVRYLAARVERIEERLQKSEERLEDAVISDMHGIDRRVQHLEDTSHALGVQVAELKSDLKENNAWTKAIMDTLQGHVVQEGRDRVYVLLGVLGTFATVLGTALFNHLVK